MDDCKTYDWDNRLFLFQGDSVELSTNPHRPDYDMIYIDTTHEYDRTKREIQAWIRRVRPRGFLVLDDVISYPDVLHAYIDCLKDSCKGRFQWFQVFCNGAYTPESHGLLVAKLK